MKITTYCCRHLWPIIECGTYDGDAMDPTYLFDLEDEKDYLWEERKEFFGDGFMDFRAYCDTMAKEILEILQRERPLEEFGVKVVDASIDSPREYNFRTDWAELTVEVPDTFIPATMSWIRESKDRLDKAKDWIRERWRSYDGWISPMPESWEELEDEAETGLDLDIVAGGLLGIMTFIAHPEMLDSDEDCGLLPFTEQLLEAMRQHSVSEFYLVYNPVDLLARYKLGSELKIDVEANSAREAMDQIPVLWELEHLAHADQFGTEEEKGQARKRLFDALVKTNLKKLADEKTGD